MDRAMVRTRNSAPGSGRQDKAGARPGFTLIELLVVMVIIALLATIIMGSATFITRLSRQRRAEASCRVLETALYRYRTDYKKWPGGNLLPAEGSATIAGKGNAGVFDMLLEDNRQDNPRGIRYFDPTTLFTVDDKGQALRLDKAKSGGPLVYQAREGGLKYFKIVINVDRDTAKVTAPELKEDQ